MNKKKCLCCGLEKSETKFKVKHGNKKYGRFDDCKDCMDKKYKTLILSKYGVEYWEKCLFDRFKDRIRNRTRQSFKRIKQNKPTKTEELLGCDWITAKKHIESFFTDNMNWDNFHEWHIDHIIPLSSASNIDELIALCRYENLQPLMAKDNIIKGGIR